MNKAYRYLSLIALASAFLVSSGSHALAAANVVKMKFLFVTGGYTPSQRFSRPIGIFYEPKRQELYVADTGNGQIVILDKRGLPVAKFPHYIVDPKTGNRIKGEPRSVAVLKNGDILVADNLCNYVDVLDPRGNYLRKLWPGDLVGKPKAEIRPVSFALDAAGNVYLGVIGATKDILVLGPDLRLKAQIGVAPGGDSRDITGLWVDSEGRVFATYAVGVCVRAFGADGKQYASFGVHDSGPNNFSLPSGIVTDSQGRLWVNDTMRHVVAVHKPVPAVNGNGLSYTFFSLAIGGMGSQAGDLTYPSAITGDGINKVFVVESTGARVQGFEIAPEEEKPAPS